MSAQRREPRVDDGVIVFVHCAMCDRFISNESTHKCELPTALAHDRSAARAAKMTALAFARNGGQP